jgi:hypothetical protein
VCIALILVDTQWARKAAFGTLASMDGIRKVHQIGWTTKIHREKTAGWTDGNDSAAEVSPRRAGNLLFFAYHPS